MLRGGRAGTLSRVRHSSHRWVVGLTAAYLVVVVMLAFVRWEHGAACPWYLNLLFFLPIGMLFTLLLGRRRWIVAVAFGMLGAAWIEAAQAIWMPEGYGRVEDTFWGAVGVVTGSIAVLLTLALLRFMRSHGSLRIMTEAGRREIPQD
jgi:VanZ like protein